MCFRSFGYHPDKKFLQVESNLCSYLGDGFDLVICSYCVKEQKY